MSTNNTGVTTTLTELINYRYQAKSLKLKHPSRILRKRGGDYIAKLRGRGMDFEEVRPYQPGDDIRTMDWRVTARTGIAHSKVYREEKEHPVFVVVDFNPGMFFGTRVAFKSVIAARIAALIAWTAENNGDRIGGMICMPEKPIELRPRSRTQGVLPLLKTLADATQINTKKNTSSLIQGLIQLNRTAKPSSLIYLISDFATFTAETERQILHLKQHNEVCVFFIYDQLEANPPKPNHYSVTDGYQIVTLNTADKLLSARYQLQFTKHLQQLKSFLQAAQIPLIQVATHDNITEKLPQL